MSGIEWTQVFGGLQTCETAGEECVTNGALALQPTLRIAPSSSQTLEWLTQWCIRLFIVRMVICLSMQTLLPFNAAHVTLLATATTSQALPPNSSAPLTSTCHASFLKHPSYSSQSALGPHHTTFSTAAHPRKYSCTRPTRLGYTNSRHSAFCSTKKRVPCTVR